MFFVLFLGSTILNDPQCPSVRPSVRPSGCPEPYNLPNRNRYEKSVITKKLRIDKIRCNKKKEKKCAKNLSVRKCAKTLTSKIR